MTLAQVYDPTKNIIASTKIQLVDFSDEAKYQVEQKLLAKGVKGVRFGLTGGGCAGFSYVFEYADGPKQDNDVAVDFGSFTLWLDDMSKEMLEGTLISWKVEGLNEGFEFISPKEESSCGCGVSDSFAI